MSWWNERGLREKRSEEKECQIGNEADESWNEQSGFCSSSVPIWLHTRTHQHILLVFNMGLDVIFSSFLSRAPQDIKCTNSYKKPLLLVPPTEVYFSFLFNNLSELICQVDWK